LSLLALTAFWMRLNAVALPLQLFGPALPSLSTHRVVVGLLDPAETVGAMAALSESTTNAANPSRDVRRTMDTISLPP
jgi:hypothetical protein